MLRPAMVSTRKTQGIEWSHGQLQGMRLLNSAVVDYNGAMAPLEVIRARASYMVRRSEFVQSQEKPRGGTVGNTARCDNGASPPSYSTCCQLRPTNAVGIGTTVLSTSCGLLAGLELDDTSLRGVEGDDPSFSSSSSRTHLIARASSTRVGRPRMSYGCVAKELQCEEITLSPLEVFRPGRTGWVLYTGMMMSCAGKL